MPDSIKHWEILLVEDNPADADLFEMALRESDNGHMHIWRAGDGKQALDFLYRRAQHAGAPRPDLIFLDLNLPIFDGRQVLEIVKRDGELADIPIVVLSTSSTKTDIAQSYKRGANSYLVKPADLDLLLEMMRTCSKYWFHTAVLISEDHVRPSGSAADSGRKVAEV